ncbi:MAG: 50S ribosomal protein L20 [Candidatus Zixiibacteriota bacterium]|nr:MAG: 50S ribosomal protein L20 [candidate division Zixibacteria bacterium]
MPRARNNVAAHRRHKKFLRQAKGNYGGRSRLYRTARETVQKGMAYAYRDRRNRKRDFRRLWIIRINAAARLNGLSYSAFINGLNKAGVSINRKMLADMAVKDFGAFAELAETARSA